MSRTAEFQTGASSQDTADAGGPTVLPAPGTNSNAGKSSSEFSRHLLEAMTPEN